MLLRSAHIQRTQDPCCGQSLQHVSCLRAQSSRCPATENGAGETLPFPEVPRGHCEPKNPAPDFPLPPAAPLHQGKNHLTRISGNTRSAYHEIRSFGEKIIRSKLFFKNLCKNAAILNHNTARDSAQPSQLPQLMGTTAATDVKCVCCRVPCWCGCCLPSPPRQCHLSHGRPCSPRQKAACSPLLCGSHCPPGATGTLCITILGELEEDRTPQPGLLHGPSRGFLLTQQVTEMGHRLPAVSRRGRDRWQSPV